MDEQAKQNLYETFNGVINSIIEDKRKEGIFTDDTSAVVFARAGSNDSLISFGKFSELSKRNFGKPPMVLIIPGITHFTEEEYLSSFCSKA